jgi:hypothetical protein
MEWRWSTATNLKAVAGGGGAALVPQSEQGQGTEGDDLEGPEVDDDEPVERGLIESSWRRRARRDPLQDRPPTGSSSGSTPDRSWRRRTPGTATTARGGEERRRRQREISRGEEERMETGV